MPLRQAACASNIPPHQTTLINCGGQRIYDLIASVNGRCAEIKRCRAHCGKKAMQI
jgi:hypothetical protein